MTLLRLSVSVLKLTLIYLLSLCNVDFSQEQYFLRLFSSMSGNCCISTAVSEIFPREVVGVVSKTRQSANISA